jgi:beta-glucosidase
VINNCDFIGLNHYYHNRINYGFHRNEGKIACDRGYELYPKSIYFALKELKDRYNKTIYITENGLADAKDSRRPWYIVENLKYVHKAIAEGVDVKGYLHWSLMDNFEWDSGFWPRFGLIEMNYKTLKRIPRSSAYLFRDICKANGVTKEILDKYSKLLTI